MLGDIVSVDVRQSAGGRWPYASAAALSPEAGGGVLLDFGVHLLDLLLWWLGDLRAVSARDDAQGGIETESEVELALANGAPLVLELSRGRDLRDTVVVECAHATVEIGVFEPALLRLTMRDGDLALDGTVPDASFARAAMPTVFGRQLAHFGQAVRGEASDDRHRPGGPPGRVAGRGLLCTASAVAPAVGLPGGLRRPGTCLMLEPTSLRGQRVLVLGASGFLGGRLVERLVAECGAQVRILVRRIATGASAVRFPVEVHVGDLADVQAVERAVAGCTVVFNCAKGSGGDPDHRRAVDVEASAHVVEAAARAGARVVHVSSLAVYDLPRAGDVDEQSPPAPPGDPYSDQKLAGERMALSTGARLGVPVTVLQPTVVYGPRATVHASDILQEMHTGRLVLVDGGAGTCNAVYVDDVVTALLLAAVREEAAGRRFLVSGPEHPTWADFIGCFERMLGRPATVSLTEDQALELWHRSQRRTSLLAEGLRLVRDDHDIRTRLLATREGGSGPDGRQARGSRVAPAGAFASAAGRQRRARRPLAADRHGRGVGHAGRRRSLAAVGRAVPRQACDRADRERRAGARLPTGLRAGARHAPHGGVGALGPPAGLS
jgi:nucleoside-diphosphate-sugar epimerase